MKIEHLLDAIQKDINVIKKVFLDTRYNDKVDWTIIEDHIFAIQDAINEYRNKKFKKSKPDPFG